MTSETINLNEEQVRAVRHGDGPLLIIAGAGTGKTTVVTQRIKYLIIEKKIEPSCILALTFTEKAALEMEERVDVALPYGYTQLWISTFHSFCDRILRDEAIHIGLNPAFKLTSEAEAMLFLKNNLFKLKLEYFLPLGNPYKFLQGMLQHFSRLKDDDITPQDYSKFADKLAKDPRQDSQEVKKIKELAYAFKTYEELKEKEGIMDFADLNANILKLFRERPNILKFYQDKFKYILVDEFQDTNFAQNELAMMLAGDIKNINVVGDDDQSIYRWRGAAIANIIHFRKNYPDATIVTLTKNYRSSKEILDAAYKLIQYNNPDRLEIKEHINKQLQAIRGGNNSPVNLLYANRVENEAEQVKEAIKKLVKDKQLLYRDIAILVRANDHSQPFARALERAKIPYQFLGPGHLFHQEEIKDLIAYLQVLANFEDNAAMYRVLTLPIFDLEARDIAALLNFTKKQNLTLFEACEQIDSSYLKNETKDIIKRITAMIKKHLRHVPRETAGQILYYFLEDSGLLQQYLGAQLPHEEKRAQNIAKFFERLKSFEGNHADASVFAVIDWIELAMQLGESPLAADMDWSTNNAVNILTVHSSKGLEFPAVFLVSLVSQRFPTRDRKEQIPVPEQLIKEQLPEGDYNLQEERRLFYVGITRAKDYLYLCASQYYGEGKRERKLSPFIIETIGEQTVNTVIRKEHEAQFVEQLSLLDLANDQARKSVKTDNQTTRQPDPLRPRSEESNQGIPITYISYSQIQSFDICPLHYKLKNILKIPPTPTAAQSFGTSIHSVLREYFARKTRGEDIEIPSIKELLKMSWVNIGYESKDHMNQALHYAEETLTKFLATNGNAKIVPLGLEVPFSFFLQNPTQTETSLKVGGRIDRIDPFDGNKIEIIDYKTGYQIPAEKKIDEDLQLSLYALAANEVHDHIFNRKPEDVTLSLWYVEHDIKISTTRTAEQLETIKQQLHDKIEEISKSNFTCRGGMLCKQCEYKMICQTYSA
jgi:DNA helicase II / ATP-dependent DNA helicase PcrA